MIVFSRFVQLLPSVEDNALARMASMLNVKRGIYTLPLVNLKSCMKYELRIPLYLFPSFFRA